MSVYPSQLLSAFADWLEQYEPHEKIEALADKVEDLEQPFESRLDAIYERLTAYQRLQEVQRELDQAKADRLALAQSRRALVRAYREATGEVPPAPSPAAVWAYQRVKAESVFVGLRRVLADLRYKTRG